MQFKGGKPLDYHRLRKMTRKGPEFVSPLVDLIFKSKKTLVIIVLKKGRKIT